MRFSKEKKFLYSRVAILLASVGWIAFAFAGLRGFPFWYGGFVLCFWVAFGLINFSQHTTLWSAFHRGGSFALLYAAIAGFLILLDRAALNYQLWFYPTYHGFQFMWVYGVLYPFAAFNLLELFYFLSKTFGEHLVFVQRRRSPLHHVTDVAEGVLFLAMAGGILGGALSFGVSLKTTAVIVVLWMAAYLLKLAWHIRHRVHYAGLLVLVGIVAAFFNEFPNTVAREWIYLYSELPFLNDFLFSIPVWLWFGWLWFILFTLRFWIVLVLHPKVT